MSFYLLSETNNLVCVKRLLPPGIRAQWHNALVVELGVAAVVMSLDVLHIDNIFQPQVMIDMSHVSVQIFVALDRSLVAFEVHDVNWVKSNQGHEKSDVQDG